MKKIILIGLSVVVIILLVLFFYIINRNRTLSPMGETQASVGDLSVVVEYSRPSVRNRVVFGTEQEGALQPYEIYWRLGANEPTRLSVSKDFYFGEEVIESGTYDLYAVPGPEKFMLVLNEGNRWWGYTEPDYCLDRAKIYVPVSRENSHTEQFTIEAIGGDDGVVLDFTWADWQWEVLLTSRY